MFTIDVDRVIKLVKTQHNAFSVTPSTKSRKGDALVKVSDSVGKLIEFSLKVSTYALPTMDSNDPLKMVQLNDYVTTLIILEVMKPHDSDDQSRCFYMQLYVPRPSLEDAGNGPSTSMPSTVPSTLSWLNQVMIDPINHAAVSISDCLRPDKLDGVPLRLNQDGIPDNKLKWGTIFMELFEAINLQLVKTYPHLVAGMVDDAFLPYCGSMINMSDFRYLQGKKPWYENYGYMLTTEDEYIQCIEYRPSVWHGIVHANEAAWVSYHQCREKDCDADCFCEKCKNSANAEAIVNGIQNCNKKALRWVGVGGTPPRTCMTTQHRAYNPRVMEIDGDRIAVRIKFV